MFFTGRTAGIGYFQLIQGQNKVTPIFKQKKRPPRSNPRRSENPLFMRFISDYSMIEATLPEPTVLPPSRIWLYHFLGLLQCFMCNTWLILHDMVCYFCGWRDFCCQNVATGISTYNRIFSLQILLCYLKRYLNCSFIPHQSPFRLTFALPIIFAVLLCLAIRFHTYLQKSVNYPLAMSFLPQHYSCPSENNSNCWIFIR